MAVRELLTLGTELRLAALGIECAHGVGLLHEELQRALDEARADAAGLFSASAKSYTFRDAGGIRVAGEVDEHEPGDIWLVVDGPKKIEEDLARIVGLAKTYARQLDSDQQPPDAS